MFWDDVIRRWRREARVVSLELLRGAGGHVAVYPDHHRQRRTLLFVILMVLLAAGALVIAGSRSGSAENSTSFRPAASGLVSEP